MLAYSLAEYLSVKRDATIERSLEKAIQALAERTLDHKGGGVVGFGNNVCKASTGATALALLAALLYQEATQDTQFMYHIEQWLMGLITLHTDGQGLKKAPYSDSESPYFNGEAWLAFATYADFFPDDVMTAGLLTAMDQYMLKKYTEQF